jgi:ABC-type glycerol-3-phosphate transport system permease component
MSELGRGGRLGRWGAVLVLIAVVLLIDFPALVVILNAFKTNDAIQGNQLFPEELTLVNFDALGDVAFGRYVLNSFIVSAGGTFLALAAAVFGGYALSRFRQRALEGYSLFLLVVQMVPVVVTLLPLFLILKNARLLDSYLGLILVYGALLLPFATWVARAFFDSIPRDLEEAAWLDGASRTQTLLRVVAPLAAPGLVSITVICFITAWNEFLLASVFLRESDMLTAPVGLQLFSQQLEANWGPVMAGSAIAMLPSLAVYLAFQRYFVRGALAGALKG